MLGLSRKAMLAVAAVVDIAHHGRIDPVSSRDFAERLAIPRRHLEPVLQALVRDGILKSVRGARGGYLIGRERRRISVGDIVRAAAGDDDLEAETVLSRAVVAPILAKARRTAEEALDTVTLDDLLARAEAAGVFAPEAGQVDFTI